MLGSKHWADGERNDDDRLLLKSQTRSLMDQGLEEDRNVYTIHSVHTRTHTHKLYRYICVH